MSIYRKVQAVERVFNKLEKEMVSFKNTTGLKCATGCGLCCHNPTITATPLEFLPLAYQLHKEGIAYEWLEEVQSATTGICKMFKPFLVDGEKGFCSQYKYRGLICRLFGFGAMRDKNGSAKLVTCKTIKTEQTTLYHNAVAYISEGGEVPIMSDYYHQLRGIDPDLGRQLVPINLAIEEALKVVLSYYAYRRPRRA